MKITKYKVKEFAKIEAGGTPSTKNPAYWEGDVPWITPNDLTSCKRMYISKGKRNITAEGLKNSSAKLLPCKTVLLTTRAPVGYVALAETEVSTNQGFKNLICDETKADPEFVYYLFKKNKPLLQTHATGSTFVELSSSRISNIKFNLPELNKQKDITLILISYDNLIDTNHHRIQLLEESARLLFREWFVYFRFPGHEKVKIVDGVPEGWEKGSIRRYFDTTSGGTPSRNIPEFFQGAINWVKTQELDEKYIFDTEEKVTQEAINKSSAKIFPANTLLVSIYGNTNIGRTGILVNPAASNQACVAFFPKKQYYHYIYLQQYLQMIRVYLIGLSQGAAQTNISQDTLRKVSILIPDELLMNKFLEIAKPIYEQIKNLQYQNQKLAQSRDLLLPRLMNGTIEV